MVISLGICVLEANRHVKDRLAGIMMLGQFSASAIPPGAMLPGSLENLFRNHLYLEDGRDDNRMRIPLAEFIRSPVMGNRPFVFLSKKNSSLEDLLGRSVS
jgi:hypothetical protein